jgi:hypothetical protein
VVAAVVVVGVAVASSPRRIASAVAVFAARRMLWDAEVVNFGWGEEEGGAAETIRFWLSDKDSVDLPTTTSGGDEEGSEPSAIPGRRKRSPILLSSIPPPPL